MPKKPKQERMTGNEWNKVKKLLQDVGASAANIRDAIGSGVGSRSREQVGADLTGWMRARPKKVGA